MTTFAVTREAGPGWTAGGIYDQAAMAEHAAFMNALADEGFLRLAGPLSGSEQGRVRVLLIVDADNEAEIDHRLADDPWLTDQRLVTVSVEPWNLLVDIDRGAQPGS